MPGRAFTYAADCWVERGLTLGLSPQGLATAREVVRDADAGATSRAMRPPSVAAG
jgi:hypothetical protein